MAMFPHDSAAPAYDADRPLLLRCPCGQAHAAASHPAAAPARSFEETSRGFIEHCLVKALFPQDRVRRAFLRGVGAATARAAIASVVPVAALQAMAQERGPLERKDLKIGFIGITCATPLIMADPFGFYSHQGLAVQLNKVGGWGLIRDKMLSGEHDASHFLSPMPLAISLGLDSAPMPMNVATIQNTNGQAITLHLKHRDRRDPAKWKGMVFGVPFAYSMHNFLLRYYLADYGLDPARDVQIKVVPPPQMVEALRSGAIDGFLGPDPFNQRAVFDEVGFIHILSKDIWDGHPCCAFGVRESFVRQNPNTFAALYRAILTSSLMASQPGERENIARAIAPERYLNQPVSVLAQVLTGNFDDGLGNRRSVPDRANFDPVPWTGMAVWMLTQMKRWGYVGGEVGFRDIAQKVFLLTDAKRQMYLAGWKPPEGDSRRYRIMGKVFDPADPGRYLDSLRTLAPGAHDGARAS